MEYTYFFQIDQICNTHRGYTRLFDPGNALPTGTLKDVLGVCSISCTHGVILCFTDDHSQCS